MSQLNLTALQRDALIELLNISVGSAAAVLSEMADTEIRLSVPMLDEMTRSEVSSLIQGTVESDIVVIMMQTEGFLRGNSMLIFSEQSSLSLVRSILREHVPLQMLTGLEEEALNEVGNIVLNACLATFSNLLNEKITTSIPYCDTGTAQELIGDDDRMILFLRVDFSHQHGEDQGFITLILDMESIQTIPASLDAYLHKVSAL